MNTNHNCAFERLAYLVKISLVGFLSACHLEVPLKDISLLKLKNSLFQIINPKGIWYTPCKLVQP